MISLIEFITAHTAAANSKRQTGRYLLAPPIGITMEAPCEGVYWRKSALEDVLLEAQRDKSEITRIESSEVKKLHESGTRVCSVNLYCSRLSMTLADEKKFTLYEQYREAKITAEEYLSGKDELTKKTSCPLKNSLRKVKLCMKRISK